LSGAKLERIPLPWALKRPFLETFLRDVHHYLFNAVSQPRPGETYRVQDEIRRRFVEKTSAASVSRPHVVVSHSLGTVIAYDCLKRVGASPVVDGLLTFGSPLGLDEVQDQLQPGWSRADGYPSQKVARGWTNFFDHLDPVCGLDPLVADDFLKANVRVISDSSVENSGVWRHSATKYLRQPTLRAELRRMLNV
jgi:hypothetical protein